MSTRRTAIGIGAVTGGDARAGMAMRLLQDLLQGYQGPPFTLRLWDGREWRPDPDRAPVFTLTVQQPSALVPLLVEHDEATLAEAYITGALEIDGDLEAVFALADHILHQEARPQSVLGTLAQSIVPGLARVRAAITGRKHSLERDRLAISHHYDVSNDFYVLWLDPEMVYSCAYFTDPEEALARAQERKLDYLCRKLRLQPGERVLDIGCGWGAFLRHAVHGYGVKADGITLSARQAEHARRENAAGGLENRARVSLTDYREVAGEGIYDKIVSVGMFEHVGADQAGAYFDHIWRLLRPGGVFLNHAIAGHAGRRLPVGRGFIDSYVFPDGDVPTLDVALAAAEGAGFEVRDVESLREHYTLTLRHWARTLGARRAEAVGLVSEQTYRIWRLYLAASAHAFDVGWISVYQTLLVKPDGGRSGLPLTRADWYR